MAGPGGGRHSGGGRSGGFGGGSRGGSFGGGFGGGHHHRPPRPPFHHPHPHHHPPYHRPFYRGGFHWHIGPRHRYGGGCLSALLAPIILVVFLLVFLFTTMSEIGQGGSILYDEKKFQDYANSRYTEIFGNGPFEDNILLVFLADESATEYCYIAWVGDHVNYDINALFGNEYTMLGYAMEAYISETDYTYNLDTGLRQVVKGMGQKIKNLGIEETLTCDELRSEVTSKAYNYTGLPVDLDVIDEALRQFTEETDIPFCVVVDDMEDVFGKSLQFEHYLIIGIVGVALIFCLVSVVKAVRRRQEPETADDRYDRDTDSF